MNDKSLQKMSDQEFKVCRLVHVEQEESITFMSVAQVAEAISLLSDGLNSMMAKDEPLEEIFQYQPVEMKLQVITHKLKARRKK